MTDLKISALPAGGAPQTSDALPIARAGANAQLVWSDILAALASSFDVAGAAAAAQAASDPSGSAASAQAASQPLDSDLTAIAALTTTTFGRALLALADAAALRTAAGLGTAATHASGDFDTSGAAAAAQAASQPLDSDLTAIAALTTAAFGISLLTQANAAAALATLGVPMPLPFRAGGTFQYLPAFGATTNLTPSVGVLYAMPFFVPVTTTFTKIVGLVTTGAATSLLRLGLYATTAGVPDALIVDAATIATTSSADAPITFSSPVTVTGPAWIWLAVVAQTAAASLTAMSGNSVYAFGNIPTTGSIRSAGPQHGYSQTGITSGLPSPWGATLTQQQTIPLVALVPQ